MTGDKVDGSNEEGSKRTGMDGGIPFFREICFLPGTGSFPFLRLARRLLYVQHLRKQKRPLFCPSGLKYSGDFLVKSPRPISTASVAQRDTSTLMYGRKSVRDMDILETNSFI